MDCKSKLYLFTFLLLVALTGWAVTRVEVKLCVDSPNPQLVRLKLLLMNENLSRDEAISFLGLQSYESYTHISCSLDETTFIPLSDSCCVQIEYGVDEKFRGAMLVKHPGIERQLRIREALRQRAVE